MFLNVMLSLLYVFSAGPTLIRLVGHTYQVIHDDHLDNRRDAAEEVFYHTIIVLALSYFYYVGLTRGSSYE